MDPHAELGLHPGASVDEITAAYMRCTAPQRAPDGAVTSVSANDHQRYLAAFIKLTTSINQQQANLDHKSHNAPQSSRLDAQLPSPQPFNPQIIGSQRNMTDMGAPQAPPQAQPFAAPSSSSSSSEEEERQLPQNSGGTHPELRTASNYDEVSYHHVMIAAAAESYSSSF